MTMFDVENKFIVAQEMKEIKKIPLPMLRKRYCNMLFMFEEEVSRLLSELSTAKEQLAAKDAELAEQRHCRDLDEKLLRYNVEQLAAARTTIAERDKRINELEKRVQQLEGNDLCLTCRRSTWCASASTSNVIECDGYELIQEGGMESNE